MLKFESLTDIMSGESDRFSLTAEQYLGRSVHLLGSPQPSNQQNIILSLCKTLIIDLHLHNVALLFIFFSKIPCFNVSSGNIVIYN